MNSKNNGSMNRVFRVVWNAATGVWQAVSEVASGHGKRRSSGQCVKQDTQPAWPLSALALAVATTLATGPLHAGELGAQVFTDINANLTVQSDQTITLPYASGTKIGIHALWDTFSTNTTLGADLANEGMIDVQSSDGYTAGVRIMSVPMPGSGAIILTNRNRISSQSFGGAADGLVVANQQGMLLISNEGPRAQINVSGTAGRVSGISLDGSLLSGGSYIGNQGVLSVTSSDGAAGNTYGINARSLNGGAYIRNETTGRITVANSNASSTGTVYGIYTETVRDTSGVTNFGALNVSSTHGSATGINVGTLSDSATIQSSQITMQGGNGAWGIVVGTAQGNSTVVNQGYISTAVQTGPATGIEVASLNGNASISNAGGIMLTSGDIAAGITVRNLNSAAAVAIDNSGTINVNSTSVAALGMMIGSGTGTIRNSGLINATMNGVADAMGFSLMVGGAGNTATNTSTGVLNGNLGIAGTLNNAGTISLPHNANTDQGGLSAMVGNFVNTGTLGIGLLTNGTTTTHSQLLTDTATFDAGSKIKVNVLAASTNEALLVGQTLHNVVKATTSLTVNAAPTIDDNSALLNFEYARNGNSIDLNAVAATTILDSTAAGGGSSNAQAAAGALMRIKDDGITPAMTPIFTALNALPSDADVARAVNSLTPVTTQAAQQAGVQIGNTIQNIIGTRQAASLNGSGLNAGDTLLANRNFWLKPFGSWAKQDDKGGLSGFDLKTRGIGLGLDGEYAPQQKLGFAFFYTNADVNVNNMAQKADLNVYSALLYGSLPVFDDKTNVLYQAGYTAQETDTTRQIALTGQTAKGNYTATVASVDLKLVRDFQVSERLLLQPLVSASYRSLTNPAYKETGAGAANQQLDRMTNSQTTVGLGVRANYLLDEQSKLITNLHLGHDLNSSAVTISSSFDGAPGVKYQTRGIDNGRNSYELGLGYERKVSDSSKLNLMYTRQGQGNSFANDAISATYSLKF